MNLLTRNSTKVFRNFGNNFGQEWQAQRNMFDNNEKGKFIIFSKQYAHTKLPRTPDLIYVPQVMRWLKNKIKFRKLKSWDPDFSEGAFIYGTTKAACRITEIIQTGQTEQLDSLLTFSAKMKVKDYMDKRLNTVQKQIIKLTPDDIKILVPLNVTLEKQGSNKKDCRVAMRILGLKWHEHSHTLRLVLVALQTEFLRDYSRGHRVSEWTISGFDILECGMLNQAPG